MSCLLTLEPEIVLDSSPSLVDIPFSPPADINMMSVFVVQSQRPDLVKTSVVDLGPLSEASW